MTMMPQVTHLEHNQQDGQEFQVLINKKHHQDQAEPVMKESQHV